jgi:hypothetical protein
MNAGTNVAINVIAGSILESLKTGLVLNGIVLSYSTDGAVGTAWIAVEFAGIGFRQVAVHTEQKFERGDEVHIQCVPNPLNPGRYMFQIVAGPTA